MDLKGVCGTCYELHFSDESRKLLIADNYNSAAGGMYNWDVYMAGGGCGAFNACFYNAGPKIDGTVETDTLCKLWNLPQNDGARATRTSRATTQPCTAATGALPTGI